MKWFIGCIWKTFPPVHTSYYFICAGNISSCPKLDGSGQNNYTTSMTKDKNTHTADSLPERLALKTTSYIGSPTSLIIHTLFFGGIFSLQNFGFSTDQIMLILTTIVSLEAIYLSIFIQITVNHQAKQIREVGADVEEISEDVEEISKDIDDIQEDVEEISKDIDDIQEDVEEISKDVDDIQEDVEEISKDVDDISEDVEEISKDIDGIQEDVEDISKDVDGISKDMDDISEDVEGISGGLEKEDQEDAETDAKIRKIELTLEELLREIKALPKDQRAHLS